MPTPAHAALIALGDEKTGIFLRLGPRASELLSRKILPTKSFFHM
jgi:hypothetical protein